MIKNQKTLAGSSIGSLQFDRRAVLAGAESKLERHFKTVRRGYRPFFFYNGNAASYLYIFVACVYLRGCRVFYMERQKESAVYCIACRKLCVYNRNNSRRNYGR